MSLQTAQLFDYQTVVASNQHAQYFCHPDIFVHVIPCSTVADIWQLRIRNSTPSDSQDLIIYTQLPQVVSYCFCIW